MSVPSGIRGQRPLDAPENEIAAHPGREVEHDVDSRRPDALDRLAVERGIARRTARLRVADVEVDDRGARACRLERRSRRSARA